MWDAWKSQHSAHRNKIMFEKRKSGIKNIKITKNRLKIKFSKKFRQLKNFEIKKTKNAKIFLFLKNVLFLWYLVQIIWIWYEPILS